jgi:uncharacterized RDD family membrane protein YckC
MIYAGFFTRFFALCIDSFIVWIVCGIFLRSMFTAPIGVIISLLYFVVFETSELRATPGKFIMGIAVVRRDGSRLDVKHALIRFFSIWLTRLTAGIGYLIALFTERKQTMHDFIADTVVVKGEFSDLGLWDGWVKQLKVIFSDTAGSSSEATNTSTRNPHTSLEELYNLYQKGILTEDEYKIKKEEYLKRL